MTDTQDTERMVSLPVGVLLRRAPGVTRWVKWNWTATAVLPGAGPGNWTELRRDGDAVEYHAATVTLELHRTLTEAYLVSLNTKPPSVFVILRPDPAPNGRPEVLTVTASAYEAQDYSGGEEIVEPVPMPPGLEAWIADFCARHHKEEEFVKRKRKRHRDERQDTGIGDARVRQTADVYRAPASLKTATRQEEDQ